jgi:glycosyltransferase involved in cell wall biosynthesis
MKIAHYVERWLELSAGFVATQIALSRHDAVVISRDGWQHLDAFPLRPRHSLHRLRDAAPERWKYAALRLQLRPLLAMSGADVVHVHFGYAARDVLDVLANRAFVLSLHGHDVTGLLHGDPHRYDEVVGAVDALVVPSKFLANAAVQAGFDRDRIRVIPSGVDTEFFTSTPLPDGPPTVAFVGRLVEKKGVDVLLDAWPSVLADHPDARLVLLGDGPQAELLHDAGPSITHLRPEAARRHEQVRDLIRSARLVTTPSRTSATGDSESLLLVNLEAAASGRPVVSTHHGGIPEFVEDGRTGLLVEEGNADALAAGISRVLGDPDLAQRLADAGPRHAMAFDVRECAARVDALYDELVARRGRK